MKILLSLYKHFVMFFPNPIGNTLRNRFWKSKLQFLGKNIFFDVGIDLGDPSNIYIGDNFIIARDSVIGADGSKGIFIGNDVSIARGVYVHGSNHRFDSLDIPINKQGSICASIDFNEKKYSIVIEDNVWIGSNAVLLSGTHLKTGSVVSSGSVISGSFPPNSIIVGNPGRLSAKRKK
tara:strand:+ start:1830 stop:2363 length:534 start_codon:yes stop_codon:yes gene_type:complete